MENSERGRQRQREEEKKTKKRKQVKSYRTLTAFNNGSQLIRRQTLHLYSDQTSR